MLMGKIVFGYEFQLAQGIFKKSESGPPEKILHTPELADGIKNPFIPRSPVYKVY